MEGRFFDICLGTQDEVVVRAETGRLPTERMSHADRQKKAIKGHNNKTEQRISLARSIFRGLEGLTRKLVSMMSKSDLCSMWIPSLKFENSVRKHITNGLTHIVVCKRKG